MKIISLKSVCPVHLCTLDLLFFTQMTPIPKSTSHKNMVTVSYQHYPLPEALFDKRNKPVKEEIYCTIAIWITGSLHSKECSIFSSYLAYLLESKPEISLTSLPLNNCSFWFSPVWGVEPHCSTISIDYKLRSVDFIFIYIT